jgi:diguanylate cyclase (GGDEF)-like protein/PAS domain S-box-containing protein
MRWSPQKSLVARLVSAYLVLAVLATVGVGAATWLAGRALLRDAAFIRLETASRQKESELTQWVVERQHDLGYVVRVLAADRGLAAGESRRIGRSSQEMIEDFKASQPDVQEILVLAPSGGRVLASTTSASVGAFRATYNFYIKGRLGPAMQSVYPSPDLLRSVLTVSAPVLDAEGRLLAVAAMHLGLGPIDQIIRARAGLGETGETFLVDAANLLVGTGGISRDATRRQGHSEGVLRALSGGSGRGMYLNDSGVPVLGVYRWLPGYQMALVAEMSQAEAFAPAGRLALSIVLAGLAVTLGLALAVYAMSRRLARPVLAVTEAAMRVAGGDLSATAPVLTRDELGNLAKAFNVMTEDLRGLYARLEQEGRERGAILQGSFDGIAVVARSGALIYCNPGMERLFGCRPEEVPSLAALADRILPVREERQSFVASLQADMAQKDPPQRVFTFIHPSGSRRWCRMKVSAMPGGRVVINAQDLTEIKQSEERVRHMALHDHLTGLPNRQLFADRLDQAMRRARRLGLHVGVLYIDLDRFKHLNDTYGHAHGDRVLVETGLRLRACVRESDTVSRLGGDEFVIILPDLVQLDDALPVADKVLTSLYDPAAGDGNMFLGASMGLACYPQHGLEQDALLARADAAMYEAKRAGGNAVRVAVNPEGQQA